MINEYSFDPLLFGFLALACFNTFSTPPLGFPMKSKCITIPLSVSTAYFLLVMVILLWYELSLGKTEFGGMIPGLVLALITIPGLFYEGWVTALFNCPRYSTCEHIVGAVLPAA